MPRDPARTRQRLLDAAAAEFSAHGLAGARVDRIATTAGVNKERIYQYFGSKVGLFTEVLELRLGEATTATALTGTGEEAVLTYALELARFHRTDPTLARLLHWEALELDGPVALEKRRRQMAAKVEAVMNALPHLDRNAAELLLHDLLSIANASAVLTNLAASVPVDATDDGHLRRRFALLIQDAAQPRS